MSAPFLCRTARELVEALPPSDPDQVERARQEADTRPIRYALGSGESDQVALFGGLKPILRQILPPSELPQARARFEALGLTVEEAVHRVPLPSTDGRALFVGRDARRVHEAAAWEARPEHDHELGRLLGYPRCCVDAYVALEPPKRNAAAFKQAFKATEGAFAPRLNTLDLAVFHYLPWLPCSFSCALSRAFADAVANHIAKRHGQFVGRRGASYERAVCPPGCIHQRFVEALDDALAAHRLVLLEDVQVSIAGTFDGERVHVRRAWPTARDRHPDAALDPDAREAVARLVALVASAGDVAADDGVLFAGGVAITRTDDALLIPFGPRAAGG